METLATYRLGFLDVRIVTLPLSPLIIHISITLLHSKNLEAQGIKRESQDMVCTGNHNRYHTSSTIDRINSPWANGSPPNLQKNLEAQGTMNSSRGMIYIGSHNRYTILKLPSLSQLPPASSPILTNAHINCAFQQIHFS